MCEILNMAEHRPDRERGEIGTQLTSAMEDPGFVIRSSQMFEIAELARQVAPTSAGIMITGESGTGKEVLARWIHRHSQRPAARFVRVNCAAMAESLIESELFGHERGAFTGAHEQRVGKFEAANGGTLLLDEISEIPLRLQAKLLRVIEERELERVGGNEIVPLNVRILATSNRKLSEEVAQGRFRLDLFHRLNVVHFDLPPLRERRDEIPLLASHFLEMFRQENPKGPQRLAPQAMTHLETYPWPGNVRELRNVIHRGCVIAQHPLLLPDHLKLNPLSDTSPLPAQFAKMTLAQVEEHLILSTLDRFQGNKRQAAEHLGITARTIANKLQEYQANGWDRSNLRVA